MPEHTIPESLIENIRLGRAALVVGAGIGVPSWKQVLERMNAELEARGQEGDEAAAKDVAKLLHKGSLVRAAGFLARSLGEATCDRIVKEMWQTPDDVPPVAAALARLPFKHVLTSFPGDLVELALGTHRPDDWPEASVFTYGQIDAVDVRRRYVLKVLGDFDSYVVTPRSVRAALSKADGLRNLLRDLYGTGSLVFVGFRFGDPDLSALLDRVFGAFEPPEGQHYLVASGVGPVTVDELSAEHHIEVVNLAGKGADETATAALLEYLETLAAACDAAQITLAQTRPDADDLEGWIAVLVDEPGDGEAVAAIEAITQAARAAGNGERLVEVLMARTEITPDSADRAALLREVAGVFENQLGDLPGAFTALTAALAQHPADTAALDDVERLARETDAWTELVGEVTELAGAVGDKETAAVYWSRLGTWYHQQLRHYDYAIASFREAVRNDPSRLEAHAGLEEVLRNQQRWAELAEAIAAHLALEPDVGKQIELNLALGELCETQLASTSRAIDAYQAASDLDDTNQDALAALERLYRRDERWGRLARVLERRAELFDADGNTARAATIRHELGELRAEKLGDLEGAISKFEASLDADPNDVDALRALEELYEKSGRADDYLRTLQRLVDVAPQSERAGMLRRLAAELEEHPERRDDAVQCFERLIDVEPTAEDGYRGLERLHRDAGNWYELVAVQDRHVAATRAPAPRVDLHTQMAEVYETELQDPHRAIEAHLNALAIAEDHRPSLQALARLYQRVEAWDRAADVLVRRARLEGGGGAEHWHQAGVIAAERLADLDQAQTWLEKSLELHANYLPAMLGLARLHKQRRSWANAVARLREAVTHSHNRLERVALLAEASDIAEEQLDDPELALELQRKILELDPEHAEAGLRVADRLVAEERWADAEPVLEMLARQADDDDRVEKARREALLGRACAALGKREKAAKHLQLALSADPDSLDAALGLASIRYDAAQAEGDTTAWEALDKQYRELLARHRTNLADSQVVDAWHRIGVAQRALGDERKAEAAFRRAVERDPHHRASLLAIIDIAGARDDWKSVVEAKRDLLEGSGDEERYRLLEEIGDAHATKLSDPVSALGAYLEAVSMKPDAHQVLHKCLDIYSEQKEWRRAMETLNAIAATTVKPARRAKYAYAAAVIARDELKDTDAAVEHFQRALDDDPAIPKAFEAIDRLLTDKQDWKALARAHRKMLKRIGEDAPADRLLALWTRLGDICLDHLDDHEAAIAAYEVASSLRPDDIERHEQLANLYLEAGPDRREDAIAELQILLQDQPDRVELYRAMSDLYRDASDLDKSFCLAQALVFLGHATDEEKALYATYRPKGLTVAKRRLTEELWQKAIIHGKEDRHLNAIFSSLIASIASTTAQEPGAFKLNPRERVSPESDPHVVARVFGYAANVLGLDPAPNLYLTPGSEGIRVANTADKGKLSPSVLIGAPELDNQSQAELAFGVGKKLAYLRPERYVNYALQTLPKIETAFHAALTATGLLEESSAEVKPLVVHMQKTVPSAVLEHVGVVGQKLKGHAHNGVVARWRSATDLTANRVGLILCNDLEIAARAIATEPPGLSTIGAKERLRDLLAYSVSESYFQVRRHLGIAVKE